MVNKMQDNKDFAAVRGNIYLSRLQRLVLSLMREEPADIYLFGSWARGEQRQGSDVDLAVAYRGPSNALKLAELREALEESTIPYNVDVVDMQQTSDALRAQIRKDGIKWTA